MEPAFGFLHIFLICDRQTVYIIKFVFFFSEVIAAAVNACANRAIDKNG